MPRILNIAVVGAGTMAQAVHLPVLRRRWDRFALTALADISPRRRREAAEAWGVDEEHRYTDAAQLVAAIRAQDVAVDAVVLASDGLHVDDVLAFIRRGIPVLVEPPLGFSEQEVRRIADFERMSGRRLVMMAYPQAHDESVVALGEKVPVRDVRMLDHEVLMPAASPLFSQAHVTVSAYDVPSEQRAERREGLQKAVEAGSGAGATQRDRDFYVKGLLTGLAHQLAVIERAYGPITTLTAARQWPHGVIPGSVEILGELEGGAPVRVVWHYLPFAAEYAETVRVLTARRRVELDLPAPSLPGQCASLSIRQKDQGLVQETVIRSTTTPAEAMWESFHAFVVGGGDVITGAEEAARHVRLLREILARVVENDGRTIDPEPEPAVQPESTVVAPDAAAPEGGGAVTGTDLPAEADAPVVLVPPADDAPVVEDAWAASLAEPGERSAAPGSHAASAVAEGARTDDESNGSESTEGDAPEDDAPEAPRPAPGA